ncbi:related to CYB2 - lactate dehydrogenase cytochrome b2 [Cephalotrichum gorgonifer]|uniref:L-lactate dehydrogenase (cytochrome) n=1 Tax=Cephalotrichum gorgonifer TaxID=2041049 RepID=A0AAE8N5Y6_9PEZI|nr:related to CYB2 - lactate dehydrogenase cytochrome b2 [Cephalotrichum gorgonifer]
MPNVTRAISTVVRGNVYNPGTSQAEAELISDFRQIPTKATLTLKILKPPDRLRNKPRLILPRMTTQRLVSLAEVRQHDKEDDIWVVVDGEVYDMTGFAPDHPGGAEIIYQYAGQDASEPYNEVHSASLIRKHLGKTGYVGMFDTSSVSAVPQQTNSTPATSEQAEAISITEPSLNDIINLDDFEKAASRTLSKKAWAYISGASNDCITRDANQQMLRRIWLRPAVMRNVSNVDMTTTLFGCRLSMPVYISPTGAVKMAGPGGEVAQAKAAAAAGIIQCISTPSSYPRDEILASTPQHAFFQLYVNKDRAKSEDAIRQVTASGTVKAIFVTVDCPVISKREADERVKADASTATVASKSSGLISSGTQDKKGSGLVRQNSSFIDSTFNWDDTPWLRSITNVPLVVKGIQRWEDAVLAVRWKYDGIVVSNHGGRAADTGPPAIITLLEIRRNCPQVFGSIKVLVDGGFRRGSDVLKAICLGASAVGIGRPFMYAVNYGQEGVEHLASILQDEVKTAMQLSGMTHLAREAHPSYVNTAEIEPLVYGVYDSALQLLDEAKARL